MLKNYKKNFLSIFELEDVDHLVFCYPFEYLCSRYHHWWLFWTKIAKIHREMETCFVLFEHQIVKTSLGSIVSYLLKTYDCFFVTMSRYQIYEFYKKTKFHFLQVKRNSTQSLNQNKYTIYIKILFIQDSYYSEILKIVYKCFISSVKHVFKRVQLSWCIIMFLLFFLPF